MISAQITPASAPFPAPKSFVLPLEHANDSATSPPTISRVNLEPTADFQDAYISVLDNVLSPTECRTLLSTAEAQSASDGNWTEIRETYDEDGIISTRNCDRILYDSPETVANLWTRIQNLVPELKQWRPARQGSDSDSDSGSEKWLMTRLNERMRFMRYKPGQYFQPHTDCIYETPSGKEKSFITLLLFLNDENTPLPTGSFVGGSTRFYPSGSDSTSTTSSSSSSSSSSKHTFTIPAKAGRVLLFQQDELLHAADMVMRGTKFTMRTDLLYERN